MKIRHYPGRAVLDKPLDSPLETTPAMLDSLPLGDGGTATSGMLTASEWLQDPVDGPLVPAMGAAMPVLLAGGTLGRMSSYHDAQPRRRPLPEPMMRTAPRPAPRPSARRKPEERQRPPSPGAPAAPDPYDCMRLQPRPQPRPRQMLERPASPPTPPFSAPSSSGSSSPRGDSSSSSSSEGRPSGRLAYPTGTWARSRDLKTLALRNSRSSQGSSSSHSSGQGSQTSSLGSSTGSASAASSSGGSSGSWFRGKDSKASFFGTWLRSRTSSSSGSESGKKTFPESWFKTVDRKRTPKVSPGALHPTATLPRGYLSGLPASTRLPARPTPALASAPANGTAHEDSSSGSSTLQRPYPPRERRRKTKQQDDSTAGSSSDTAVPRGPVLYPGRPQRQLSPDDARLVEGWARPPPLRLPSPPRIPAPEPPAAPPPAPPPSSTPASLSRSPPRSPPRSPAGEDVGGDFTIPRPRLVPSVHTCGVRKRRTGNMLHPQPGDQGESRG
ncbi:cGMP-dependent protein kinase, isozyme 2 forms cD5/T2, partial [Frankliniella fusca]